KTEVIAFTSKSVKTVYRHNLKNETGSVSYPLIKGSLVIVFSHNGEWYAVNSFKSFPVVFPTEQLEKNHYYVGMFVDTNGVITFTELIKRKCANHQQTFSGPIIKDITNFLIGNDQAGFIVWKDY